MKKILAILLTLVMVISMFAGCDSGHDNDPTTEPTQGITGPTINETEAPAETTVPETEAPAEAETETPTEAPTEPEATVCGHNYTGKVTTAATCTTDGVMTYSCEYCGNSYTERITGKHDYECTDTRPATCSNTGDQTYTCKTCGTSYKETLPKNEHKWSEWVVTVEPTTTSYGQKVRECELCYGAQFESIDPRPGNDGGNNDDIEGSYYWFGNIKKPWDCASQGHHVTNKDIQGKRIQSPSCIHDEIWEYTCDVVGCGATWTENRGGAGGVLHKMSAADQARITKGDYFYHIKCSCGRGVSGSTRDEALAKHNAHVAENLYDGYCGIMREWDGHYHNFPSSTFICSVCQQSVEFSEVYAYCDEC